MNVSESTKLFRRAKTARRNQAAHAKRLILGSMIRGSCCELEVLAWPIRFEASRYQTVNRDVVACDLARQHSNEAGQFRSDADCYP